MAVKISFFERSQKSGSTYFSNLLNASILTDICYRITGQTNYIVEALQGSYNKGRLVYVQYNGWTYYVTLSELEINGRNSSMQSVPTALNIFYADTNPKKKLFYYFLPNSSGNPYTDYHIAYYRLLMTAGVEFLNINQNLGINAYSSIDELIFDRDSNRAANRSNNSSYVTMERGGIQIYAKTFGASKYESTALAIAASKLNGNRSKNIQLFNIVENSLKVLPESSQTTIKALGNIDFLQTDYSLEKKQFTSDPGLELRSPLYTYNLLNRLGHKCCALCGCEIPEIIQGAHIWGVSQIKNAPISDDDKFHHAVNEHNGLWLCSNHHKLFDSNIISIHDDGTVLARTDLPPSAGYFIRQITLFGQIKDSLLSDQMKMYINYRNGSIPNWGYERVI